MFITGPAAFEYNAHASDSAIEWTNWVRGFELFAKASKIVDDAEKCSSLLHYAGPKVQKIFFNLPPVMDEEKKKGPLMAGYGFFHRNEYDEAILRLANFFAPKRNATYERHVFRQMKQDEDERIEIYAMRLRTQAERCEFGKQLESNIKDQITEGCTSSLLRRKILERGDDDFDAVLKMAKVIEAVSEQQKTFDRHGNQPKTSESAEEVNKIDFRTKSNRSTRNQNFDGGCSRCGHGSHKAADNKCPAMGKTCAKCGGKNHFARKCFTRGDRNNQDRRNVSQTKRPFNETKSNVVETSSEPFEKRKKEETPVQLIENCEYDDVFLRVYGRCVKRTAMYGRGHRFEGDYRFGIKIQHHEPGDVEPFEDSKSSDDQSRKAHRQSIQSLWRPRVDDGRCVRSGHQSKWS